MGMTKADLINNRTVKFDDDFVHRIMPFYCKKDNLKGFIENISKRIPQKLKDNSREFYVTRRAMIVDKKVKEYLDNVKVDLGFNNDRNYLGASMLIYGLYTLGYYYSCKGYDKTNRSIVVERAMVSNEYNRNNAGITLVLPFYIWDILKDFYKNLILPSLESRDEKHKVSCDRVYGDILNYVFEIKDDYEAFIEAHQTCAKSFELSKNTSSGLIDLWNKLEDLDETAKEKFNNQIGMNRFTPYMNIPGIVQAAVMQEAFKNVISLLEKTKAMPGSNFGKFQEVINTTAIAKNEAKAEAQK